MTDIEQKALALVNEVAGDCCHEMDDAGFNEVCFALYLSIEQHEAFRQEVSDAVEGFWNYCRTTDTPFPSDLARFIIAKPDPLVEALDSLGLEKADEWAPDIRKALAARGGRIVWGEKQ